MHVRVRMGTGPVGRWCEQGGNGISLSRGGSACVQAAALAGRHASTFPAFAPPPSHLQLAPRALPVQTRHAECREEVVGVHEAGA